MATISTPLYDSNYENLMNKAKDVSNAKRASKNAVTIKDIIDKTELLKTAYQEAQSKFNTYAEQASKEWKVEMVDETSVSGLVKTYSTDYACDVTKGDQSYRFVAADNTLYSHEPDFISDKYDLSITLSMVKDQEGDDLYDTLRMARQMYMKGV